MADTVTWIKCKTRVITTPWICLPHFFVLALALTGSPVTADPQADVVNERLPASMADREQHWGVNCDELASHTRAVLLAGDCPVAEVTHQIRLCGFLYQPPGEASLAACPDYAAAWTKLNTTVDSGCAAQREDILRALSCAKDIPGNGG